MTDAVRLARELYEAASQPCTRGQGDLSCREYLRYWKREDWCGACVALEAWTGTATHGYGYLAALEALDSCLGELEYHEREGHTGISVAANDARAVLRDAEERLRDA